MNKNVVLGVIVLLLVAAIVYGASSRGGGGAATEPVEVPGLDDNQTLVNMAQGVTMGEEDAPITIAEFADYQCPGCMGFAGTVQPQVKQVFVDSGKAKFIFYDFPLTTLHMHSFLAARAARCADDQGKFWEYHDALFRHQSSWAASPTPPVDTFEDYAAEVGLDQGQFRRCLRSDKYADVISATMTLGQELGVTGTPTVIISRGGMTRRVSNPSFEGISAVVDELSPDTAAAPGGTP